MLGVTLKQRIAQPLYGLTPVPRVRGSNPSLSARFLLNPSSKESCIASGRVITLLTCCLWRASGCHSGGCAACSHRGLRVSTSRHVEIRVVQEITFSKTIQPFAIRRGSQSIALLVPAEESPERTCGSFDPTSDQCVSSKMIRPSHSETAV